MKKILSVVAILVMGSLSLTAQKKSDIRINGYAGYTFDDKIDSYYDPTSYYRGTIRGGFQGGIGIESKLNRATGIELLYLNQATTAPMEYYKSGIQYKTYEVGLNYYLLSFNRYFGMNPKVEPYFSPMLGLAFANIKNPNIGGASGYTKFAWGLRAGANIWASSKVGIKLQMQLLSVSQGFGGGAYFGTGGAGFALSSYSSIYQFGLGGGLTFKLGK